jgi:hypothetical protein
MKKCIGIVVLALAVAGLALPAPAAYAGPNVGSSKSDQPHSTRQFTITNNSSQTVTYDVWWGDDFNGGYKGETLKPGYYMWYSVDPDKNGNFPQPKIHFPGADRKGNPVWKFYVLKDNLVTDGQTGTVGSPKAYTFDDAAYNSVDLHRQ